MSTLRTVQLVADAGSLLLTAPAALAGVVCSCRTGGLGVGRHSPLDGCRVVPIAGTTAAAASGVAATVEVTITAFEVALLMAFCGLQATRLIVARRLNGSPSVSLLLNMLATALLLTATSVLAANNPRILLYSGPFALLLPALLSKLASLTVGIVAEMSPRRSDGDIVENPNAVVSAEQPVDEKTLGLEEQLLYADQDSLVYSFRDDGTLEWRMGSRQGSCTNLEFSSSRLSACGPGNCRESLN
ncbi:hypothetical protein BOX15_Mlig009239g2 [Macrostomum lignano]|uniref:Uncharacterized protein n=2 Tax=Macrostomum lignano TaxID=282301 RepID=A0A267GHJ8_9PLAT|nr:hypothetical protein BOX15_Mlig009239g1 [Macrostomum lignano]PAA85511.1 hypothetical protein BOX15_Mlig009239g2 [Macrostomum lignano]